jgi:hypothetical protein
MTDSDAENYHVHGKTPVAIEVEHIMDERARHFEARWNRRTAIVNRRLLFLFVVMFLAIGYFAYRGEQLNDRVKNSAYESCKSRAAQFNAYNQAMPTAIAQIVSASNPGMDGLHQAQLVAALTVQLQIPPLLCVEPN